MDILVDAADHEDLLVVLNGLRTEELLWLFQRTLATLDLVRLRIEREAVADPAIVATEDENFLVVQREAAHRVTSAPVVLTVCELHLLPLLSDEVTTAVQALDAVKRLLILRITPADYVDEAVFEYADGMEVA